MTRTALLTLAAVWVTVVAPGPLHAAPAAKEPPIYVVSADDTLLATLLLAGAGRTHPVLLFDPRDPEALTHYAREWKGAIECFYRASTAELLVTLMAQTVGSSCTLIADPLQLARQLWPDADFAVAFPADDYAWMLRAAAFAGTRGALLPVDRTAPPPADALSGWSPTTLYLTPPLADWKPASATFDVPLVAIESADALGTEMLRRRGDLPVETIVVANPRDRLGVFSPASLSLLAPLVSAAHQAPLVLVSSADSKTIEKEVSAFVDAHQLRPQHIILVGDELALRSHAIPDPVLTAGGPEARGGGTVVRTELFSQVHLEQPQDFAVGRIVAEDAAQASAAVARQLHRRHKSTGKPAIFLVNADQVFNLGETISRTTASELRNVGVPVRAHYGTAVTPDLIQRSLKQTDVLVWEGHPRDLTLEERGGIAADTAPDFVFLQGCYTLDRSDPFILMDKGTRAIVATSAAIYSAPGSAFARALFDALLYEDADLGTAVRNARNYLLSLSLLQRERGHAEWRKTFRAALAFALWGDPTARPALKPRRPRLKPAAWQLTEGVLSLDIPRNRLPEARVGRYRARPAPRAMLSGLILREPKRETRLIKDLHFGVLSAPGDTRSVCRPHEGWNVVSLFAPRTGTLTVLARPDWDLLPTNRGYGEFTFPVTDEPAHCPPLDAPPPKAKPPR